jgi:hypothetical protein
MATKPEDPLSSEPLAISGQEQTNQPEDTSGSRATTHVQHQSGEVRQPAFEFGWQSYLKYGRESAATPVKFEDVEPHLAREWRGTPQSEELPWEVAQEAARDAWDRVQEALTGDTRGDETLPKETQPDEMRHVER